MKLYMILKNLITYTVILIINVIKQLHFLQASQISRSKTGGGEEGGAVINNLFCCVLSKHITVSWLGLNNPFCELIRIRRGARFVLMGCFWNELYFLEVLCGYVYFGAARERMKGRDNQWPCAVFSGTFSFF